MSSPAEVIVSRFLEPYPPKAAQLIVTIYGDIVEPRGGVLWMGNLISLCAGFDVNESLVRTAVSRLVSKRQLDGQREGRRSYYALTPEARDEYHLAADLFFGPPDGDCDWIITCCSNQEEQAALKRHGFAPIGGNVFAGAARHGRPHPGIAFKSELLQPKTTDLAEFVETAFDLQELAADYSAFINQFSVMKEELPHLASGETALLLRIALVHAYRSIRIRDPRLPKSALPDAWPGFIARQLFADLYIGLSHTADAYIGEFYLNQSGALTACPETVTARLKSLAKSA